MSVESLSIYRKLLMIEWQIRLAHNIWLKMWKCLRATLSAALFTKQSRETGQALRPYQGLSWFVNGTIMSSGLIKQFCQVRCHFVH